MPTITTPSVTFTLDDFALVSETVMSRFPARAQEQRRILRTRELLDAASGLGRALSTHTQHALVDCQGSHGTCDLHADTAELCRALSSYANLLKEVAAEFRPVVRPVSATSAKEQPASRAAEVAA